MSTFSGYGMGPKGFLVNRPLNDYEQEHRLDIKEPASDKVHYDLSLIKFNSTFLECVDKWYSMRGFLAMAMAGFGAVLGYGLFFGIGFLISENNFDVVLAMIMVGFMFGIWFLAKFFLLDAFTYTHYPIRFNRRNRQVYAFRRDGTVLKAGWDDIYWTMFSTGSRMSDIFVAGHLMDSDHTTVRETIGLSMVGVAPNEEGLKRMRTFFEFFRRYMEEGPGPTLEALRPVPLIMLPGIDKEKESWFFGWEHLTGSAKGFPILQLLFQVFFFPISLFRWIVMRTSKIPQWPQWVEDECAIDPADPWVRDGRHRA